MKEEKRSDWNKDRWNEKVSDIIFTVKEISKKGTFCENRKKFKFQTRLNKCREKESENHGKSKRERERVMRRRERERE